MQILFHVRCKGGTGDKRGQGEKRIKASGEATVKMCGVYEGLEQRGFEVVGLLVVPE